MGQRYINALEPWFKIKCQKKLLAFAYQLLTLSTNQFPVTNFSVALVGATVVPTYATQAVRRDPLTVRVF
jgi:hypothetical protein